jgi:Zn-dependent M28 family amino/carboxypeptidase
MKTFLPFLAAGLLACSCGNKASLSVSPEVPAAKADIPAFDADSAYACVARQVAFGPRVPNTPAHRACADYFAAELERYGAAVYVQEARLKAYDGTILQARNIIGTYRPEHPRRILLCAHWDSRPFADHAAEEADRHRPIDGADDGASGCGVLLEIARQLGRLRPPVGVDIILFDAEDYGMPDFAEGRYAADSWCLGSQFWAANPHVKDYRAEYGILLDMVGATDAAFFQELTSLHKAAPIVKKVWDTARSLGFGQYFLDARGGAVTDDHVYVMAGRHFPCIDIIHHDPESPTGFAPHWHTPDDGLSVIDTQTLHAVGQTLLQLLYSEKE